MDLYSHEIAVLVFTIKPSRANLHDQVFTMWRFALRAWEEAGRLP